MPEPSTEPYRLFLLGPWDLRGPDDVRIQSVLSQPKRLCLLAYLALTGEPVSRSTLVSLFWPESDEDRARNALSQAIHYLRRSLSRGAVQSVEGDRVQVARDVVWFDARALLEGDWGGWADVVRPPGSRAPPPSSEGEAIDVVDFFQGWNADDCQPLQDWLDTVRGRVAATGAALDPTPPEGRDEAEPRRERPRPAHRAPSRAAASGRRLPGPRRWRAVAAFVGTALVAVGWSAIRSGSEGPATLSGSGPDADRARILVLMPTISTTPTGPTLSGEGIRAELVAHLSEIAHARVETLPFDIERLRRLPPGQVEGQPTWVVAVLVRAAGDEAIAITTLLRGPEYREAVGVVRGDYALVSESAALLEFPGALASDIVTDFRSVLERR